MAKVTPAVFATGITLNELPAPDELPPLEELEEEPEELLPPLEELPLDEEDPEELPLEELLLEELLLDELLLEELLLEELLLEELLLEELPVPELPPLFESSDDPPHPLSARVKTSPRAGHAICGDFCSPRFTLGKRVVQESTGNIGLSLLL
jgi:hypothetical protein